ncbi:MAG: ferritin [Candidatus Omnitrophica bacterium]|nr:ferritin [Candidatus Omnitrophota bacterium]
MDKKLAKAMNEQVKNELYSAYLYLAMAAYCDYQNLPGFAHWMKTQAKEEQSHAMKIYGFLNNVGERVVMEAIAKPPAEFDSPADVFKKTLEHEKKVTALINDLYNLAQKVQDNAAAIFLQWFVTEQVEEEKNAADILAVLKVIKADSGQLILLDKELGKRE